MPAKKSKPVIRTDPTAVREPKSKPKCIMHEVTMVFQPERGMWQCPVKGCKLQAFPPNVAEKGKPILGEGQLELVLVKDPDGNKRPRTLLRTVEQNIMIDITDYVTDVTIEREEGMPRVHSTGGQAMIKHDPGIQYVELNIRLYNITDTR